MGFSQGPLAPPAGRRMRLTPSRRSRTVDDLETGIGV